VLPDWTAATVVPAAWRWITPLSRGDVIGRVA